MYEFSNFQEDAYHVYEVVEFITKPVAGCSKLWNLGLIVSLKEKLPQAFIQIEWMEDNFRNLTAKVWANLDNPIKIYDFSKVS